MTFIRALKVQALIWSPLVLAAPLAFFAALHAPNEYRDVLGIDALDCTGPGETYMLAVPALLFYGGAAVVHAFAWRKHSRAMAALVCLLVCAAVSANVGRAFQEELRQAADCRGAP